MTKASSVKFTPMMKRAAAIAVALIIWQLLSLQLQSAILLPSPIEVFKTLGVLMMQGDFYRTIGYSFLHIACGFLLGLLIGVACAIAAARFQLVETLLAPYMSFMKATPVASFILLALVFLSAKNLSIFICMIMVLPVIYTNLLRGIHSLDPQMEEMARVFALSYPRKIVAVYLPQLKPFLISSLEISIGMAWKAGIAAEVIGTPAGSIGKMLYNAKIYLITAEMFAWTLVVVLISMLLEKLCKLGITWINQHLEEALWILH